MTEFLKSVARRLLDEIKLQSGGPADPLGLTRYLLVYPNHRSGLFLGKYLAELAGTPLIAPRTTTIAELYQMLSPLQLADPTELLFRLYTVFADQYRRDGGDPEPFDKFIFWGQMLLADFGDIDKYSRARGEAAHMKEVRALYTVVRDHREIDEEFSGLDPHLAQILADFWTGLHPDALVGHDGRTKEAKAAFLRTWNILYDVYSQFRGGLAAEGKAYEGMLQRDVTERLALHPDEMHRRLEQMGIERVVFVSLTALSLVDERLLTWLKEEGIAEFAWDWADPRLAPQRLSPASPGSSHAAFFPSRYAPLFPNLIARDELEQGIVSDGNRHVSVVRVPSGVGQTETARQQLEQWLAEGIIDTDAAVADPRNPIHTAVVLPDEGLLFPMLYSLPKELAACNVTMGYSLKMSSASALVDCLAAMQYDARPLAGGNAGYRLSYRAVLSLLSHTYLMRLAPDASRRLVKEIQEERLYEVSSEALCSDSVMKHFMVVADDAAGAAARLRELMCYLLAWDDPSDDDAADVVEVTAASGGIGAGGQPAFEVYEREFISHYIGCIERIEDLLHRYPAIVGGTRPSTFYALLQRLVRSEQVPFSGEPLQGLQLMGVLETRSLDFDNLIVLSMNEGLYPAGQRQNSFIPPMLREGFGLPTQSHRDSVYAFHFYRMLSRARRVVLVYDCRTEGGGAAGECSRYVHQLKYLCPDLHYSEASALADVTLSESSPIAVRKDTPAVRRALARFLEGGDRVLSATAIKDFLSCPLKFYLRVVRGLKEADEITDGIDGALFGTIVHNALERLYRPAASPRRRVVTAEWLGGLINEARRRRFDSEVGRVVMEAFREGTMGREAKAYLRVAAEGALDFVLRTLAYDRDNAAPITLLGTEWKQAISYAVPPADNGGHPGFTVRLFGIYDRMDIVYEGLTADERHQAGANVPAGQVGDELAGMRPDGRRRRVLRIVDYKTETADTKMCFTSPAALLTSAGSPPAFQLMLYAVMLHHATSDQLAELGLQVGMKGGQGAEFDVISPHLYFIRSMNETSGYRTPLVWTPERGKKYEVWDIDPLREEFEEAFQQTLRDIFDTSPGTTFAACKDPDKGCQYCEFAMMCRRGA